MMERMGNDTCQWGMMGMGLIGILLVLALVLGIAALIKYLLPRRGTDKSRSNDSMSQ